MLRSAPGTAVIFTQSTLMHRKTSHAHLFSMKTGNILGLYRGYIGIMEKKMETTTVIVIGYILGLYKLLAGGARPRSVQATGMVLAFS